ncbi:MAG TPA: L-arabinonate dehydratase [Azospirillaceae bacterium]|nr:L-arabinonate dehydratase [Azospirillaceae bacterium]
MTDKPARRPQERRSEDLRSHRWFGAEGMRAFAHRQRIHQVGIRREEYAGKPVIGILNTWSEISTCHAHLRDRAEQVKRGVLQAGGFPLEIPAMSLGEVMVKPTTMFYRNLLALEVEELIRSHPLDGVVLMGGCDKTTPGLVMGATSANLPAIYVPAGATLSGNWRGRKIGTGTHTRAYWDALRAGEITQDDWRELEDVSVRSFGTCNTMGTASTMTIIAETLGLTLPGAPSIPAVDSAHARMASRAGERCVAMVWEDLKPRDILTHASFENAIAVHYALGGSTNAVVHLLAMAGRAGVDLTLDDLERWSGRVPVIADLMPAGRHLMEDLYYAGGSRALLSRLAPHLDLSCRTVSGGTLGEALEGAQVHSDEVIRTLDNPVTHEPALAVLKGNLAPSGAVIKPSAASPHLLVHRGRAVVFETAKEMYARIDDPALEVDASSVLVLKNAGPVGAGMPEWGGLPIPQKLLRQGIKDMVRISDARMSGTHFGTCVLHVAPESAVGGPLALVETGDWIELDVPARRLHLDVADAVLAERAARRVAPPPRYERGYGALFARHVMQADRGCDFDFLTGTAPTAEPDIF